jgi:hypothetical protein
VRHDGQEYELVSFAVLGDFACDTPDSSAESTEAVRQLNATVPPHINALQGRRVAVDGFMLPMLMKREHVTGFLLLRDQGGGCFGIAPPMNGWVYVTMAGKRTAEATQDGPSASSARSPSARRWPRTAASASIGSPPMRSTS